MTSGCLDRKEVRGAIWGVHSTTDRPAGGNTGRLFLAFGGPVCADRISNCPLDRVLTYKNLIYLLNLQNCFVLILSLYILYIIVKCYSLLKDPLSLHVFTSSSSHCIQCYSPGFDIQTYKYDTDM